MQAFSADDAFVPFQQAADLADAMRAADPAAYVENIQLAAGTVPFGHGFVTRAALDDFYARERLLASPVIAPVPAPGRQPGQRPDGRAERRRRVVRGGDHVSAGGEPALSRPRSPPLGFATIRLPSGFSYRPRTRVAYHLNAKTPMSNCAERTVDSRSNSGMITTFAPSVILAGRPRPTTQPWGCCTCSRASRPTTRSSPTSRPPTSPTRCTPPT